MIQKFSQFAGSHDHEDSHLFIGGYLVHANDAPSGGGAESSDESVSTPEEASQAPEGENQMQYEIRKMDQALTGIQDTVTKLTRIDPSLNKTDLLIRKYDAIGSINIEAFIENDLTLSDQEKTNLLSAQEQNRTQLLDDLRLAYAEIQGLKPSVETYESLKERAAQELGDEDYYRENPEEREIDLEHKIEDLATDEQKGTIEAVKKRIGEQEKREEEESVQGIWPGRKLRALQLFMGIGEYSHAKENRIAIKQAIGGDRYEEYKNAIENRDLTEISLEDENGNKRPETVSALVDELSYYMELDRAKDNWESFADGLNKGTSNNPARHLEGLTDYKFNEANITPENFAENTQTYLEKFQKFSQGIGGLQKDIARAQKIKEGCIEARFNTGVFESEDPHREALRQVQEYANKCTRALNRLSSVRGNIEAAGQGLLKINQRENAGHRENIKQLILQKQTFLQSFGERQGERLREHTDTLNQTRTDAINTLTDQIQEQSELQTLLQRQKEEQIRYLDRERTKAQVALLDGESRVLRQKGRMDEALSKIDDRIKEAENNPSTVAKLRRQRAKIANLQEQLPDDLPLQLDTFEGNIDERINITRETFDQAIYESEIQSAEFEGQISVIQQHIDEAQQTLQDQIRITTVEQKQIYEEEFDQQIDMYRSAFVNSVEMGDTIKESTEFKFTEAMDGLSEASSNFSVTEEEISDGPNILQTLGNNFNQSAELITAKSKEWLGDFGEWMTTPLSVTMEFMGEIVRAVGDIAENPEMLGQMWDMMIEDPGKFFTTLGKGLIRADQYEEAADEGILAVVRVALKSVIDILLTLTGVGAIKHGFTVGRTVVGAVTRVAPRGFKTIAKVTTALTAAPLIGAGAAAGNFVVNLPANLAKGIAGLAKVPAKLLGVTKGFTRAAHATEIAAKSAHAAGATGDTARIAAGAQRTLQASQAGGYLSGWNGLKTGFIEGSKNLGRGFKYAFGGAGREVAGAFWKGTGRGLLDNFIISPTKLAGSITGISGGIARAKDTAGLAWHTRTRAFMGGILTKNWASAGLGKIWNGAKSLRQTNFRPFKAIHQARINKANEEIARLTKIREQIKGRGALSGQVLAPEGRLAQIDELIKTKKRIIAESTDQITTIEIEKVAQRAEAIRENFLTKIKEKTGIKNISDKTANKVVDDFVKAIEDIKNGAPKTSFNIGEIKVSIIKDGKKTIITAGDTVNDLKLSSFRQSIRQYTSVNNTHEVMKTHLFDKGPARLTKEAAQTKFRELIRSDKFANKYDPTTWQIKKGESIKVGNRTFTEGQSIDDAIKRQIEFDAHADHLVENSRLIIDGNEINQIDEIIDTAQRAGRSPLPSRGVMDSIARRARQARTAVSEAAARGIAAAAETPGRIRAGFNAATDFLFEVVGTGLRGAERITDAITPQWVKEFFRHNKEIRQNRNAVISQTTIYGPIEQRIFNELPNLINQYDSVFNILMRHSVPHMATRGLLTHAFEEGRELSIQEATDLYEAYLTANQTDSTDILAEEGQDIATRLENNRQALQAFENLQENHREAYELVSELIESGDRNIAGRGRYETTRTSREKLSFWESIMDFFKKLGEGDFKEAFKSFGSYREVSSDMSNEDIATRYAGTSLNIITNTNEMIDSGDKLRVLPAQSGERPSAPLVMFLSPDSQVYSIQREGLTVEVAESGGESPGRDNTEITIEGVNYTITGIQNGRIQARGENIETDLSTILRRKEAEKRGGLYVDNYNGQSFLWTPESITTTKPPTPLGQPFQGATLSNISQQGEGDNLTYRATARSHNYEFKYENNNMLFREIIEGQETEFQAIPTPGSAETQENPQ